MKSFKHWWGKLSDQEREINDEEFLDIIIETDQMENSQVWNNNINESYYQSESEETNESTKSWGLQNWLIMGTIFIIYIQTFLSAHNGSNYFYLPLIKQPSMNGQLADQAMSFLLISSHQNLF